MENGLVRFAPRRQTRASIGGGFCRAEIDIRRNFHPPLAFQPSRSQPPRGSHPRAQTFYKYALACRCEKKNELFPLPFFPSWVQNFISSIPFASFFSESDTRAHCHALSICDFRRGNDEIYISIRVIATNNYICYLSELSSSVRQIVFRIIFSYYLIYKTLKSLFNIEIERVLF